MKASPLTCMLVLALVSASCGRKDQAETSRSSSPKAVTASHEAEPTRVQKQPQPVRVVLQPKPAFKESQNQTTNQ